MEPSLNMVSGRRGYFFSLLLLCVVLYFPGLGARDFWAPVEPRYAEIARVMLAHGEWVIPTINGELYTDKPILYFWLVLIGAKIIGSVNEWSVRLPSALSALGLVLATYALGRDFFGARAGFLGAIVLATTARVIWEGRWAHTDMPFTLFFTLSLYFWARANLQRGAPREYLLAYGLMGLATLTKGFIGVVLPGLIWLGYVALRRDWRGIFSWRLPAGAVIFFLVTLPWFGQVTMATGGRWLEEFVIVHHIQRYTSGAGHEQPFYYYLVNFPADLLPWLPFLVSAIAACLPVRASLKEPAPLFLCVWFAAVFIFFSVSDTKRALYLLPAFPPVALGIGCYFDALIKGNIAQSAIYRWLAYFLFGVFLFGSISLPVAAWYFQRELVWFSVPAALVMAGGGLVGIAGLWRRSPRMVFFAVAATVSLTMLWVAVRILPFTDRYKSPKPFAVEVKRLVPKAEPLYIYADTMNDFNFYAERELIPVVSSPDQLERLTAHAAPVYLLIRDRDVKATGMTEKASFLAKASVGSKKWSLVLLPQTGPGS
ncbi:MAG: glycosyltransferase family 39 protein [Deltaproteobacteria bacterium]|nr:glycosyltransferase family 39 protein [Deltaproteobacteria bacterium]